MRDPCVLLFITGLAACSKVSPPPPVAPAPAVSVASEAEEPVILPTRPTPAFLPRENGACSRAYKLVEDTCVHRYYEQSHPGGMEKALAAYKRGAAPPMLGPVPTRAPDPPSGKAPLDPGALRKRSEVDANAAKERRLAELDMMLEAAREKLRQRDEANTAKHVENAPKRETAPSPAAPATPGAIAIGGNTGSAANPGSMGDPTAARLNELSQLAHQLSSEQLQALTNEPIKSGVNTAALDQMMRQETGFETPR